MTNERIIEIEVTPDDLKNMRANGYTESELPALGVKKYRPARHILRDKVVVLLDADIVEHFKNEAHEDDKEIYQTNINQTLRQFIESEKRAK